MDFRYTRHQVPRGSRADAETSNKLYLFKNVAKLRLTYQIRLLTYRAMDTGMPLIIKVPTHCDIHPSLGAYVKEFSKMMRVERF